MCKHGHVCMNMVCSTSGSQDNSDLTFTIDDKLDGLDNGDDNSNTSSTESNPMNSNPVHPTSGLMTILMQLESRVLHRMCSVTSAALGKFQMASLMVSSLEED